MYACGMDERMKLPDLYSDHRANIAKHIQILECITSFLIEVDEIVKSFVCFTNFFPEGYE